MRPNRSTTVIRTAAFALFVCFMSVGCGSIGRQIENASMDNLEQQAEPSDGMIRELFVESGLGEGDESLAELNRIERDRVVRVVRGIKEKGIREGDANFGLPFADERLRIKAAYFLAKLGDDPAGNDEFLLRMSKSKDPAVRIDAVDFIAARVGDGRKEFLPILFEEAPGADGHVAEGLVYFFADEAETATETFLTYLAKEPKSTRIAVFKLIAMSDSADHPDATESVRKKVAVFTESPALKAIATEFLANVRSVRRPSSGKGFK